MEIVKFRLFFGKHGMIIFGYRMWNTNTKKSSENDKVGHDVRNLKM